MDAPFERPAIQSSSPNTPVVRQAEPTGSSQRRPGGARAVIDDADPEHEQRADRGKSAHEPSLERDAPERAARADGNGGRYPR